MDEKKTYRRGEIMGWFVAESLFHFRIFHQGEFFRKKQDAIRYAEDNALPIAYVQPLYNNGY